MENNKIKLENGKVIIADQKVINQIKDQGLEFNNDGSLKVEEGANITISVTWG